jgi:GT2 family glycosyltransferase
MLAAGYRSVIVPEAVVIHHDGVASRAMDGRLYLEHQYTGMLRYFRKHHPLGAAALVLAWPGRWLASLRRPREPGGPEAGNA